jgi:xanthine/uracil permease
LPKDVNRGEKPLAFMDLIDKVVIGTVAVVIGVYLVPVAVEAMAGTNTSNWTKITGGAGAIAIFGLLGLVFVAGFAIALLKGWISM